MSKRKHIGRTVKQSKPAPEKGGGVGGSADAIRQMPPIRLRLNGQVVYEGIDLDTFLLKLDEVISPLWDAGEIDAAWIDAGFHTP